MSDDKIVSHPAGWPPPGTGLTPAGEEPLAAEFVEVPSNEVLLVLSSRESVRELAYQLGMNMLRTAQQLDAISAPGCAELSARLKTLTQAVSSLRDDLNVKP